MDSARKRNDPWQSSSSAAWCQRRSSRWSSCRCSTPPSKLARRRDGYIARHSRSGGSSALSEIELINIVFGEDKWLAKKDVITFDFESAKTACFESRCAGFEFAARYGDGGMDGEVPKIGGVPKDHGRGDAGVDVAFIVVRQTKTDHFYIIASALFDGFRSAGNGGRTDGHQQFHIGIRVQDGRGFGEGFVFKVIAGAQSGHLKAGIFLRAPLLDVFLPLVHVGGGKRRCDDGKLALSSQDSPGFIHQCVSDALRRGLVDQKIARVRLRVRIPGDHLDPFVTRLTQGSREG